jgi:hypothetical protein
MADWDDVRRIALALPGATEGTAYGRLAWKVGGKLFVWERPLRARDLEELGCDAPAGPILGVRVEHLGAKEALLAEPGTACFTTAHFDGHAIVMAELDRLALPDLEELVVESWLVRAPPRSVAAYRALRGED